MGKRILVIGNSTPGRKKKSLIRNNRVLVIMVTTTNNPNKQTIRRTQPDSDSPGKTDTNPFTAAANRAAARQRREQQKAL